MRLWKVSLHPVYGQFDCQGWMNSGVWFLWVDSRCRPGPGAFRESQGRSHRMVRELIEGWWNEGRYILRKSQVCRLVSHLEGKKTHTKTTFFLGCLKGLSASCPGNKVWQRCPRHFGGECLPQHRTAGVSWKSAKSQDLVTENRGSELEIELTGLGILSSQSCAKFEGKFLLRKTVYTSLSLSTCLSLNRIFYSFILMVENLRILKVFDLTWGWILLVVMCYICSRTLRYVTKPLPRLGKKYIKNRKTFELPFIRSWPLPLAMRLLSLSKTWMKKSAESPGQTSKAQSGWRSFLPLWESLRHRNQPSLQMFQWYETVIFDGW